MNVLRQPPCEAVSWNAPNCYSTLQITVSLLVRLWVEIQISGRQWCRIRVSLLVRLWVEILHLHNCTPDTMVSLLVRLWVEMCSCGIWHCIAQSASLWGCELKCICNPVCVKIIGQPPCEAVSWNNFSGWCHNRWSKSASLWGCELK